MRQQFLCKQGSSDLILFFAGFGQDPNPFAEIKPEHCDLAMVYDYSDLRFSEYAYRNYARVHLIAWSMGVKAAAVVTAATRMNIVKKTAINGTLLGIDDKYGIAPSQFAATLQNLNADNLRRFYRRMCGGASLMRAYLEHEPQRSMGSLINELTFLLQLRSNADAYNQIWDEAYIGMRDLIFPPQVQLEAWREHAKSMIKVENMPHYASEFFARKLAHA